MLVSGVIKSVSSFDVLVSDVVKLVNVLSVEEIHARGGLVIGRLVRCTRNTGELKNSGIFY